MDSRISRDEKFMQQAEIEAKRGTCLRRGVGAIIVKDNHIIGTGYNGPPAGEPHCFGATCPLSPQGGCTRSIHAEQNAIIRANQELRGTTIYCTISPCLDCAKLIVDNGIVKVFYRHEHRCLEGISLLLDYGISVYRISEHSYIIEEIKSVN